MPKGKTERVPEIAAELVRLKVDIIVSLAASTDVREPRTTETIPIIMTGDCRSCWTGFIASLARPGGNITGLTEPRSGAKRETTGAAQGNYSQGFSCRRLSELRPAPANSQRAERTESRSGRAGIEVQSLDDTELRRISSSVFAALVKERG